MRKINKPDRLLVLFGTVIFLLLGAVAAISPRLSSGDFEKEFVPVFTALLAAAAAVYFLALRSLAKNRGCTLLFMVLFGLGFRILFFFSEPILENDFHRYFWDGAVTSSGLNPYEHSPEKAAGGGADGKLAELGALHGDTLGKVNHPQVRTIYPPVAELFFALSYAVSPAGTATWRILLLAFDLATLALLLACLARLNVPLQSSIVYWWNPLLLKEIFNSMHMDVLVFPFLLGAVLLFLSGRKMLWAPLLALAAGVKLWPALLFGMFLKPLREKRETALKCLLFAGTLAVVFLPMVLGKLDSTSGIVAYGKSWQNNSAFFAAALAAWEFLLESLDIHPGYAQTYSRAATVAVLLAWKFYVVFGLRSLGIFRKALLIVGAAFLLSPAQFPWYYTWLLPFLCAAPSPGFLALTALLPLYYLQYYFPSSVSGGGIFAEAVVWIEFAPVWALLAWECLRFRNSGKVPDARDAGG